MRALATPGTVVQVCGRVEECANERSRTVATALRILQAKPVFEVLKRIVALVKVR